MVGKWEVWAGLPNKPASFDTYQVALPSQDWCLKGPSQAFLGVRLLYRESQKKSTPASLTRQMWICTQVQWGGGVVHRQRSRVSPSPAPQPFSLQIANTVTTKPSPRIRIQGGVNFPVRQMSSFMHNPLNILYIFTTRLIKKNQCLAASEQL